MENKEQQYKNLTLISINNTLHIKADNLEPVEVDSSCVDYLTYLAFKDIKWYIHGITNPKYYLHKGINISELADRIEVRDTEIDVNERKELFHKMHPNKTVADFAHKKGQTTNSIQSQFHNIFDEANVPTNKLKAFLLPEKEEKGIKITDIEIPKSKGLKPKTEWCVTKEQMLEELTSMQKKLDESYTIEEIKETLRKYIKHVDDCEGSNFISRLNTSESDVKFSELEVKLLEELSNY